MNIELIFGLIGSAILAYIIPKLSPKIDSLYDRLSKFLTRELPSGVKSLFRSRKLKKIIAFRKLRANQDAVTFQIIKAHSYFILFWGVIAFYVFLLVMGPYYDLLETKRTLALIFTLPIYFFEILWIIETGKAKKLVKQRGYFRTTRK